MSRCFPCEVRFNGGVNLASHSHQVGVGHPQRRRHALAEAALDARPAMGVGIHGRVIDHDHGSGLALVSPRGSWSARAP